MQKKLDPPTIRKIRELYKRGECKQQYLAAVYGISSAQISRIINFKRRKRE